MANVLGSSPPLGLSSHQAYSDASIQGMKYEQQWGANTNGVGGMPSNGGRHTAQQQQQQHSLGPAPPMHGMGMRSEVDLQQQQQQQHSMGPAPLMHSMGMRSEVDLLTGLDARDYGDAHLAGPSSLASDDLAHNYPHAMFRRPQQLSSGAMHSHGMDGRHVHRDSGGMPRGGTMIHGGHQDAGMYDGHAEAALGGVHASGTPISAPIRVSTALVCRCLFCFACCAVRCRCLCWLAVTTLTAVVTKNPVLEHAPGSLGLHCHSGTYVRCPC